jgi:hypothetical protein
MFRRSLIEVKFGVNKYKIGFDGKREVVFLQQSPEQRFVSFQLQQRIIDFELWR